MTQIVSGLIILTTLGLIFFPNEIDLLWPLSIYTPQIMFFFLFLSFLFLVLDQKALMVTGLLATAAVAFQLKNASNSDYIYPDNNPDGNLEILHINLDVLEDPFKEVIGIVGQYDPDLISFQKYDEHLDNSIYMSLYKDYPYTHKIQDNNGNGLAIFSRKKIFRIDNFYYKGLPNLKIITESEDSKLTIISSYIPSDYNNDQLNIKDHLQMIADEIKLSRYPVITMGNFNRVYWSNELKGFMKSAQLQNSRRSVRIDNLNPEDHIFYSKRLECTMFQELKTENNVHLGIRGSYQSI